MSKTPTKWTDKKEAFCQAYILCNNQSQAYRETYDVKEGTKPETVWSNACQLMSDTKVAQRVYELQQVVQERTLVTVESLCEELEEARELALSTEQPSAVTGAVMAKAKLHGLDINKTEIAGAGGGSVLFEFNPVGSDV